MAPRGEQEARGLGLYFETAAHQLAECEHVLVCERVPHEQSLSAPRDEPGGKELLQMLAEIPLCHPGCLDQFGHRPLAMLQLMENGESRRLREGSEAPSDARQELRSRLAARGRALRAHAFLICVGRTFTTTRKRVPITSAGTIAGSPSVLCTVILPKSNSATIG